MNEGTALREDKMDDYTEFDPLKGYWLVRTWGPSAAFPGAQKWILHKRRFPEGSNEHFCQGVPVPPAGSAFRVVTAVRAAASPGGRLPSAA